LSVTKIASSQKDFIFLSPERAATYQPRATPWVNGRLVFSPERALHKKSDKTCNALSGLKNLLDFYPGRCPGLVCCCPFRAKKNNIRLYEKRILFTGNFGYTQLISTSIQYIYLKTNNINNGEVILRETLSL